MLSVRNVVFKRIEAPNGTSVYTAIVNGIEKEYHFPALSEELIIQVIAADLQEPDGHPYVVSITDVAA